MKQFCCTLNDHLGNFELFVTKMLKKNLSPFFDNKMHSWFQNRHFQLCSSTESEKKNQSNLIK